MILLLKIDVTGFSKSLSKVNIVFHRTQEEVVIAHLFDIFLYIFRRNGFAVLLV